MEQRRVVVTGMGIAAPNGLGIDNFFDSLEHGVSGVKRIELFDPEMYRNQVAAYINAVKKTDGKSKDRIYQILDLICNEILDDSKIELDKIDKTRTGVCLGSCLGNVDCLDRYYSGAINGMETHVSEIVDQPHFMPAKYVAEKFNLEGVCSTIDTACASGTNSIGFAYEWIKFNKADLMFAGGVDPFTRLSQSGFGGLMSLTTTNMKPFSIDRDGLVLGEAGVIFLVEDLRHALARGAKIYAEIVGFGLSNDAYHETKPDPEGGGAVRAMRASIKESNVNPSEISYINAHGTGTPFNDSMEIKAISKLAVDPVKTSISSIKPMVGHCLGASGSINFASSIFALEKNIVPPTINFTKPLEKYEEFDFVPNECKRMTNIDFVISNSFAFGGNTACIALKKYRI
jgi:3-oxoacyl-[acyl-carrier-protein] synthase II